MKKPKKNSSFWLCLLINMLLNLEWTIPAWILLGFHFVLNWSLWPFWLALVFWIAGILLWMNIVGWATRCGNSPDKPKENKNPYSVKRVDPSDRAE